MKSIFDDAARNELVSRIGSLQEDSKPLWGKMNVYQMIRHCTLWDEMIQGEKVYKQVLMGRIFGRMALRSALKDEAPLRRSTPTLPSLKVSESGDVQTAKARWITGLEDYAVFSKPHLVHVFFGRMTKEQIGFLAYKHVDHHLRQFGA